MASETNESGKNVARTHGQKATKAKPLKLEAEKSSGKPTEKSPAKSSGRRKPKEAAAEALAKPKPATPSGRRSRGVATDKAPAEKVVSAPQNKPAARTRRKPSGAAAPAVAKTPAAGQKAGTTAPVASAVSSDPKTPAEPPAGQPAEQVAAAEDHAQQSGGAAARRLAENIERIEVLGHRLMAALSDRAMPNPGVETPGPEFLMTTAQALVKTLAEQPARVIGQQANYWGETLKHYATAQMALARGQMVVADEDDEAPADKRFSNPLWQSHPYFNFVKKQYLINARALEVAAQGLDLPDDITRRRVAWMTGHLIDMMSPTNFLATNPDALEKAIATEGESLVQGLENLVRDVEQNGGDLVVSLADREAFTVGENIGTSEGSVVHRTPLYELIQYKPVTEQAHAIPLLIFPPWINKFYILDLKPQNSLIRWLVEQGYTLFIVSWKNPDPGYAETGMEDYVGAYLEAMDKVRDLTDQRKLNVVGYCIAGTTLALTLSLLKQRGDDRVNSATLFTALTDFSDLGEFTTYLQDDFVNGIADEVERHGVLRAHLMSRTMSFLRANDLVWGPAIRSYMLGETPPAFDLLFWNGDSTNLPGRMAMQYLRGICQQNRFAGEGLDLMGHRLRLADIDLPLCAVACETDHIAPWKDCWRGVAQMRSRDKTFILSQSGHIAGIVNPPSKKKYGHYAGGRDFDHGFEAWRDSSEFTAGSWWPRWGAWLAKRSGKMVPARAPDGGLLPAPGDYVHERAG